MAKLHIVIASTRPTRVGHHVAHWFDGVARQHGKFDVTLVDLREVNLPVFDEPKHPRFHQYEHEHTKRWSATVNAADAFVFVTPEYNYGSPPSLLNAITYLYGEWAYKPAAFVSYGGVSGGTRAVQMTKQVLTTLRVMPIPEAVSIPFIAKQIEDGRFTGGEAQSKAATLLLDELHRWTLALATLRAG
jgi:NAD(P)H-dependent FMN reductase